MIPLTPPDLDAIRSAADRLRPYVVRTPLIPLNAEAPGCDVFLKLENLQPVGSFKIRPASNVVLSRRAEAAAGIRTASSGNMAQGVAWIAAELDLPATVLLPRDAAPTKVAALQRLGADIRMLDDADWWRALHGRGADSAPGLFVHPVADPAVLAGNATVGLEIVEDLPEVDTVLVPFGGGGLSTGIGSALRAAGSSAEVIGVESDHCTPLAASLRHGSPQAVPVRPSFVSGIGIGPLLEEMWPLVRTLVAGAVTAHAGEIAAAVRLLFERHRVIAEGAGAAPVAAALAGRAGRGKVVCVVSGGNLDDRWLLQILGGKTPRPGGDGDGDP